MNVPKPPPAEEPQNANRQLPQTSIVQPGFPPPVNPAADIGEINAALRAVEIATGKRFGGTNVKAISSIVMSYKDALQLGSHPDSVAEDDRVANTPVRVVEIAGNFQIWGRPGRATSNSYTKGYIILRAADGLHLSTRLFK